MKRYINDILTKILTLTLLLFAGANVAWGQDSDPYEGVWYIASGSTFAPTTYTYNPNNPSTNYYLCPTEGWAFFVSEGNVQAADNGRPFLTTFPCRNGVYDATKAVWTITKKDTGKYYIRQTSTGKYLVSNGAICNNPDRARVHLETISDPNDLNDNALFSIYQNSEYLVIKPIGITDGNSSAHGNHESHKWLTVNQGNKPNLDGTNARTDGPNDFPNTGGIVCLYTESDNNASFYLEKYSPSITFNASNQIQITAAPSGATLIYTTDGSKPTSSPLNGTEVSANTVSFDPDDKVTTIKAIAIVNGEESDVATFTPPVLLGSTHKRLIQSQNNGWTIDENTKDYHFYMIPGNVNNNVTKLNTTSLFRPSMGWYFLNANAGTDNVSQYYYIVNNDDKYLCYDGTNNIHMLTFDSNNANKFKFSITESPTEGAYNIRPYSLTSGNRFLNKDSYNSSDKPINLVNSNTEVNSLWKFVLPSDLDTSAPFTASNTTSRTFYKIANVGGSGYYIVPGTTNVITSNSEDDTMNWRFELAQAANESDWLTYYYIRNAVSGDYLYFTKDANNAGACLEMRNSIASGSEDRYMFTWAKTADTNVNYYIIPKLLEDASQNQFSALRKHDSNTSILTNLTRSAGNFAWNFVENLYFVDAPMIEVSDDNSAATPSSLQNSVELYYTIGAYDDNETEPDNPWDEGNNTAATGATLFTPGSSSPIALTNGKRNVIKVIAVKTVGENKYISTIAKKVVDRRTDTSPDYSGYYYIQNHKDDTYYLYPTNANEGSTLKTDKKQEMAAVWQLVKQQGTGAHNIIHYSDGKYLTTVSPIQSTSSVTLTTKNTTETGAEIKFLFVVEKDATEDFFIIKPINANQEEDKNFLNPIGGNGKTIGLWLSSDQASQWLMQTPPAKPTFSVTDINVTMTPPFGDVFYKVDNLDYDGDDATNPTATSGTKGTNVTLEYGPTYKVKAVSAYKFDGTNYLISDDVAEQEVQEDVANPMISSFGNTVNITSSQEGVSFKYSYATTNDTDPKTSGTDGNSFTLISGSRYYVKAIAYNEVDGKTYWSDVVTLIVNLKNSETIHTLADVTDAGGNYILADDFKVSGTARVGGTGAVIGTSENPFTGVIDGQMRNITTKATTPLFDYIKDAIIKNIIIEEIGISGGSNAGAIANVAQGTSRIYNCGINSGSVGGGNYVGGIVGLLDGSSRVINCYSYANITGGDYVGGIVGYNNVAYNPTVHKTMVMNCMFYGEASGTSIAPIYNGAMITNDGDANGVNNFNYFRLESSYIKDRTITKVYNCALGAETRFLQRFEFYRHLLNSNRELAAWWATGNAANKDEMMKWVLEPSQIGSSTPYPILKAPGYYASVVNYTPSTTAYDEANRNKGYKLTSEGDGGVLHVTISMGTGGAQYPAPSGAAFKAGVASNFDLTITDKDFEHFNFNYGKVQLPYYNDYCDGNYTGNRVVTGWKITSITGGTAGSYSTGADDVTFTNGELTATPYNFADRKCKNKDLYSVSNRIFNQGAYWDVPEGVTAITIEPYWGKAVYLSDAYWDVTYKNSSTDAMATAADVTTVGGGQHYENGVSTFNGQTVFTSMGKAISSTEGTGLFVGTSGTASHTVYDYAVVLVGNYHHTASIEADSKKPYTVTSVDLDGDNEPDYSLMLRFNSRIGFHPVRYDFLNLIGLGMAQKTTGGTGSYNLGIMQPKYWFEVTNTALFRVTQFEYSPSGRAKKPIILQGGVIEQWVTQQQDAGDLVEYFHVGGNVWFKEFHRGSHQDNEGKSTPHPPVSVTGGDFDEFYLTGLYQAKATTYDDNAECYINGGRFGIVAGTGMEGLGSTDGNGNITWVIDNADITEFYGGGINADKPIHGNIYTIIKNSHVTQFCGGPKFGDMEDGRTVNTIADKCTFGTYFGAGYGGNSYSRFPPKNYNEVMNVEWNNWIAGTSYPSGGSYGGYKLEYNSGRGGIATQLDYQFIPMSGNTTNVARLFIDYVSFSLATTHNVSSTLNGCTINGNFYGGGNLGKVDGNVTSTLTNCMVNGNVFGAGYSASKPTVEVMPTSGFITEPRYDEQLGSFIAGVLPSKETTTQTTTYTWKPKEGDKYIDTNKGELYTTVDLSVSNLGSVSGAVTLNLNGNTKVGTMMQTVNQETNETVSSLKDGTGNVYGGGDSSYVYNTTTPSNAYTVVNIAGNTEVFGDVFGGGNNGEVSGSSTVNIVETLPTTTNNSGN